MSCSGKGYGKAQQTSDYLYSQFVDDNLQSLTSGTTSVTTTSSPCLKLKNIYPSFTPSVSGLSTTTSLSTAYTMVYVNGSNFFPNGSTFIQFGSFGYVPAIFYNSSLLSFVVPLNLTPGNYIVKAVNLYNGNFSLGGSQNFAGNHLYSNYITYTIT